MIEERIVLMTKGLSKAFGGIQAVHEITSYFLAGRMYAIIGPNGAGKTTFFNLLSGFFAPDSGEVYFNPFAQGKRIEDCSLGEVPSWKRFKMGLGRLFQDVRVFTNLNAEENLLCFGQMPGGGHPIFSLTELLKARPFDLDQRRKAIEILDIFEIRPKEIASALSFGKQKMLALGRVLMLEPSLMLLDEPFAGIHPSVQRTIRDFLIKSTQNGKTILIIEHDISFISDFIEWAYLFIGGRKAAFGKIDEIFRSGDVVKGIWGI